MKKIVSLFQRNYDGDRLIYDEIVPDAEWVRAGEGKATQKHDGTCCLVRAGRLYKRFDAKHGKTPPANFEPAQDAPDPVTGHWPGWVPVGNEPDSVYHREAFGDSTRNWPDGTYELIGPKIQGNPERSDKHILVPHGSVALHDVPRDFVGLRLYLAEHDVEGIVWHHPDGRMVKVKAKDFGLHRNRVAQGTE